MSLTFCKSMNPRKQYPPADLRKQDTGLNIQAYQDGGAPICIPSPSTDSAQSQDIKNKREMRTTDMLVSLLCE